MLVDLNFVQVGFSKAKTFFVLPASQRVLKEGQVVARSFRIKPFQDSQSQLPLKRSLSVEIWLVSQWLSRVAHKRQAHDAEQLPTEGNFVGHDLKRLRAVEHGHELVHPVDLVHLFALA